MKERPILFSGPMVRAILDGRKTQTRRRVIPRGGGVMRVRPDARWLALACTGAWHLCVGEGAHLTPLGDDRGVPCPYGAPGDRIWVRESFRYSRGVTDPTEVIYPASLSEYDRAEKGPWKPSIHMPRVASRITLAVTKVRVERLQAISEVDAQAEGVDRYAGACDHPRFGCDEIDCLGQTHRASFAALWDAINGDRAVWASNPWVWVIEFKRIGGAS